jgi:hypothetical protein
MRRSPTPTTNEFGPVFTSWRTELAPLLHRHGVTHTEARRLANLMVAAVEGAVVLVTHTLRNLLESAVAQPSGQSHPKGFE